MNFRSLINPVTSRLGRQLLVTQKHSPKILLAAGVVGMGVTVVLACRATLKLDEVLQGVEKKKEQAGEALEYVKEYTQNDYKRDMVIIHTKFMVDLTKLYGPAVVLGLASIAALTSSHVILNSRYLGVTAAYAAIEKGFGEYRRRVADEYGEDKDLEFRHGLVDKEIFEDSEDGGVVRTIKALGEKKASIYSVFFDERSSSWSRSPGYNQVFLQAQQNYANDLLRARGHVFLNEVYDMLGLPRTKEGSVVGWILPDNCTDDNRDGYIDFGVFRGDTYMGQEFVSGNQRSVLLDFNVDGVIWDKI